MKTDTKKAGHTAGLRIQGPTVRGTFFIADTNNHVWDGVVWRGFGYPKEWTDYKDAVRGLRKAEAR